MLITIVTVVKNSKNQIARTLESINNQSYKNLELIVVDGDSSDGTEKIIGKYFKKFKLISRKDLSVYDSINYACKIANGDMLCLLHAGDIYYDNNVIQRFSKNSAGKDILSSNILYFDKNQKITRLWKTNDETFEQKPYKFAHTGFIYSKKIYKNFLYDKKMKISADSKFLIKISKQKVNHQHLNFFSVCMMNQGLSTNVSHLKIRISEDLRYLWEYHGILFFWYYFLKIISKFPSYFLIDKVLFYENKLKKNINFLEKSLIKKKIYNFEFYNYFNKIKMISNFNKIINSNKNFVLSALNLAFLGSYSEDKVILYKDLYHWPDGFLPLSIFKKYSRFNKIPGRDLLRKLKLNKNIKYVHVIGNLEQSQKKILKKILKKNIFHTKLPYKKTLDLIKFCPKFKKNVLYIFTLPTPKQEEVAEILTIINDNFKILLLGGAINIVTGLEKEVPKKIENFEFLWRLRYETMKRIIRLFTTGLNFIFHYVLTKKLKKIL